MWNILVYPADKKVVAKTSKAVSKYFKEKDIAFNVYFCMQEGELESIANTLTTDGDKDFIIVGENQAVNEFINGAQDLSNVGIGIVPAGNNDFARVLKPGKNIRHYLDQVVLKEGIRIDVLQCNERKALGFVSCGIDVPTIEKFENYKSQNSFNYFRSLTSNVFSFGQMQAKVNYGDKSKVKQFLLLAFCNSKYMANKLRINPHANLSDGLGNLIIIPPLTNFKRFMMLTNIRFGKHVRKENVEEHWEENISLESDQNFKLNIDGKIYEMKNPAIKVLPNALMLYLGRYKCD